MPHSYKIDDKKHLYDYLNQKENVLKNKNKSSKEAKKILCEVLRWDLQTVLTISCYKSILWRYCDINFRHKQGLTCTMKHSEAVISSLVCESHTVRSKGCFHTVSSHLCTRWKHRSRAFFTRPHFNWASPTARMWLSSVTVSCMHTGSFKNTIITTSGPSDTVWVHSY